MGIDCLTAFVPLEETLVGRVLMRSQRYLIIFCLFFLSFGSQASDLKTYDLEQNDPILQKLGALQEIKETYHKDRPVKFFFNPYDDERYLKKKGKRKYYIFECPFCNFKRTFNYNDCVFVGEALDHLINIHQGDIVKEVLFAEYGRKAFLFQFTQPAK